jgi:hypothetical protein
MAVYLVGADGAQLTDTAGDTLTPAEPTGTADDVAGRMSAVLPPSWFPAAAAPVLTAVLEAAGYVGALVYSIVAFASLQLRIATASGGWLDMICFDFLARTLARGGMSDASFAAAIKRRILRQGSTRAGISAELQALTGTAPTLIEGFNPGDCGALGGGPVLIGYAGGGTGYSATQISTGAGYWGTRKPAQLFVKAPPGSAAASDIYATVLDMTAAGVAGWVAIP